MKNKKYIIVILALLLLVSCQNNSEENTNDDGKKVEEVIQGSTYTYLKLSENGKEFWIAINKRETKVGEKLYFTDALEMNNFRSKELNRTFDKILFVSKVSNSPMNKGGKVVQPRNDSAEKFKIEPVNNGITIQELYANKQAYAGREVIVKGKVVKYNAAIMNRNWLHIEDGTSFGENNNLTITTDDVVKVGDVVTMKGIITLSKDFGAGYYYDVIMEHATLVNKQ